MMTDHATYKQRAGFTLIEILLGLTIFSVIALILYSTFAGGIKLNEKSAHLNKVYREARWSFEQMSKDLERAILYDYTNSYPETLSFVGNDEELMFHVVGESGIEVIQYRLERPSYDTIHQVIIGDRYSGNRDITITDTEEQPIYNLVREQFSLVDYMTTADDKTSSVDVLSSRVLEGGLKFSYASAGEEGIEGIVWGKEWAGAKVPSGVRIEVAFLDEDKQAPLTLQRDVYLPISFVFKKDEEE